MIVQVFQGSILVDEYNDGLPDPEPTPDPLTEATDRIAALEEALAMVAATVLETP